MAFLTPFFTYLNTISIVERTSFLKHESNWFKGFLREKYLLKR